MIFMQDNALIHKAGVVMGWFEEKAMPLFLNGYHIRLI
jgi:hypothetical protein